jgi:hypothetical protein
MKIDTVEVICITIILISLTTMFYLSYNFIRFMEKTDIFEILKMAKELINMVAFFSLFTAIITFTGDVLVRYRKNKKESSSPRLFQEF